MQILKTAGRKIKFEVIGYVDAGGVVRKEVKMLPDQGLGQSCHDIVNALSPGAGAIVNEWDDDKEPKDYDIEEQAVAQGI